jgi:hypothetical protein
MFALHVPDVDGVVVAAGEDPVTARLNRRHPVVVEQAVLWFWRWESLNILDLDDILERDFSFLQMLAQRNLQKFRFDEEVKVKVTGIRVGRLAEQRVDEIVEFLRCDTRLDGVWNVGHGKSTGIRFLFGGRKLEVRSNSLDLFGCQVNLELSFIFSDAGGCHCYFVSCPKSTLLP